MSAKLDFINRNVEIAVIERLIAEHDTLRYLCIEGEGGIGKTRLLQHVHDTYSREAGRGTDVLITPRIDFSAPEMRVSENLEKRIAIELGEVPFGPYFDSQVDRRKMEMAGVSRDRLREERERVDQQFIQAFNRVSASKRIVLLFDTVEQVFATEAWEHFLKLSLSLQNTLVIFAGRSSCHFTTSLIADLDPENIVELPLSSFDDDNSLEYLAEKESSLGILLEPELKSKILWLAQGRPLRIDMMVDWLAHDVPLEWLVKMEMEAEDTLPEDKERALEAKLVAPIVSMRTSLEELQLIMVLVWPLEKDMAARLTEWSKDSLEETWQTARRLSVVRELEDGRLMLHDEVRRMVLENLRAEIEPEREQQWFSRAVQYMLDLESRLRDELDTLKTAENSARELGDTSKEWSLFVEQEAIERALWTINSEYRMYLLQANTSEGLKLLEEALNPPDGSLPMTYREVVYTELQRFKDQLILTEAEQLQIGALEVDFLTIDGRLQEAESLALSLLSRSRIDKRRAELLIKIGNIAVRQGRFVDGKGFFRQAIDISRESNLISLEGRSVNALGWVSRRMGQVEEAARYYRSALQLSLAVEDEEQQALVLNNLGYVYALQRDRDTALRLCEQALSLWRKMGNDLRVGAVYSTLGEISAEFNELDESIRYLDKALSIFEELRIREWLSTVHWERGKVFWLMNRLDDAKAELEGARSLGVSMDSPIVAHYLAEVYFKQGDLALAEEFFELSYTGSRELPDPFYELNSLGDLVNLRAVLGQHERAEDYVERLNDFRERYQGIRYRLPEGLLLRYLGDLYIRSGNLQRALELYCEGFSLIADAGSYYPYTIKGQLEDLESRTLPHLDVPTVVGLGRGLEEYWVTNHLEDHPDALPFFSDWKHRK